MNSNVEENGDSVIFTISMKVKETQIYLKKEIKLKNIVLINNPMEFMVRLMKHV